MVFSPFLPYFQPKSKFRFYFKSSSHYYYILIHIIVLFIKFTTKQNFSMMHVLFGFLIRDYSLLTMIKHMSQEVDGKSHKEINSFISLIIWVLQ